MSWAAAAGYFSFEHEVKGLSSVHQNLEEAGETLLRSPLPWVPGRWALDRFFGMYGLHGRGVSAGDGIDYSPARTFGAFCVLAPYAQVEPLRRTGGGPGNAVRPLLTARGADKSRLPELVAYMEHLGWNNAQQRLAVNWVRRRVSTIGRASMPAS
jgi:hypothetical protein